MGIVSALTVWMWRSLSQNCAAERENWPSHRTGEAALQSPACTRSTNDCCQTPRHLLVCGCMSETHHQHSTSGILTKKGMRRVESSTRRSSDISCIE